jgi:hypothetical protein
MPLLRTTTRRVLGAVVAVAALAGSFTAGVVAGAGSTPAPVASPGVLDAAAEQISSSALTPVDRAALDAAAIQGMLGAAGDQWGTWAGATAGPVVRASRPEPGVTTTVERTGEGPAVARVVVPAFRQGAGQQVRRALGQVRASRSRGVLLDLRGNGGGRLDEAVETASAFLDGGPVVRYSRRGGGEQRLDAVGSGDTRTPVVVLVDGGTASAAEVVAGALQDRGRAVLVGSQTFGKGSVQEPRDLPDGSALELTVARYTTPSGRSLEGVGLAPDIEVAAGSSPDVAVKRGVEVLTGLLADGSGGLQVSGG